MEEAPASTSEYPASTPEYGEYLTSRAEYLASDTSAGHAVGGLLMLQPNTATPPTHHQMHQQLMHHQPMHQSVPVSHASLPHQLPQAAAYPGMVHGLPMAVAPPPMAPMTANTLVPPPHMQMASHPCTSNPAAWQLKRPVEIIHVRPPPRTAPSPCPRSPPRCCPRPLCYLRYTLSASPSHSQRQEEHASQKKHMHNLINRRRTSRINDLINALSEKATAPPPNCRSPPPTPPLHPAPDSHHYSHANPRSHLHRPLSPHPPTHQVPQLYEPSPATLPGVKDGRSKAAVLQGAHRMHLVGISRVAMGVVCAVRCNLRAGEWKVGVGVSG